VGRFVRTRLLGVGAVWAAHDPLAGFVFPKLVSED